MIGHLRSTWPGQVQDSHVWPDTTRPRSWRLPRRIPEKETPGRSLPDYQQYLHRMLGSEMASYFLHPPAKEQPVSPRVRRLLMAGLEVGAEDIWKALHEEPERQREVAAAKEGLPLAEQVPWLGCPATTRRLQQVTQWRQQLRAMHHLGKQRQRTASHLLAAKHIADLSDPCGMEGPTRYLHGTLEEEKVLLH
ncbi:hypothetical protein JRQ81_003298 [Phrynocephalus forsythii]|uniref:Uncharacterized protein n=1 Tax=Phrynocephalus forsythii TaxID=171643 RepID=A0A9Q0XK87_9SAUR|nr:hypothetical protein JRQ81_003298 [Phrynocephalus forsythii]